MIRTTRELQNVLLSLLEQIAESDSNDECVIDSELQEELEDAQVRSFERVGMMTNDSGLVLSVGGREFQITIVER
jgi:hypothetical protein